MTETLPGMSLSEQVDQGEEALVPASTVASPEELEIARELVASARARGVALTGPEGLLKALTKTVIETALDEELADHLGYDKHDPAGRNGQNSRNGRRTKTVLTDNAGPVEIEVPRDREGSFDPQLVKKRQRRLGGVDTIVLSLTAKGLTTGEVSAHFAEVYGASVSKDTVSRITDRVVEEMVEWMARPLEKVYAAVFIDAIYVKIRDGQVGNRPIYAAIGVDLDGHKDILGLWAGVGGGESAKFWLQILSELRNRGVEDIFFVVCDGLKGLPDSVGSAYPAAIVQTCIIHLIRNTFRYASKKYWGQIAADLKPIYRAPSREAAWRAFEEFEEKWGKPYPAISRLWRNAWEQFVPFLDYDPEIRTVLCSTNAIESLHARYRRAVSVRGHFPTEQAAMKCLYMVTRSLDPKGTGQTRWVMRWKPALNAFAITFADRMPKAENR
jgi:putative transposase